MGTFILLIVHVNFSVVKRVFVRACVCACVRGCVCVCVWRAGRERAEAAYKETWNRTAIVKEDPVMKIVHAELVDD